ncbi:hypothetical protein [Saccharothrix syringae]|uniref:hypothetical protein n=1 Tax=Saccharothrix syringae TaxID=103733 RepID=UPI000B240430|nr:hypothetical protein [Saccharothrix syringae]
MPAGAGAEVGSARPATGRVTVAEAENAPGGRFDHDSLDAIAEVAACLPRP